MLGLFLGKDIIKILFCIGLHKKQWDISVIIEIYFFLSLLMIVGSVFFVLIVNEMLKNRHFLRFVTEIKNLCQVL